MNVFLEIDTKNVHEEMSSKGNTLRSQTLYMWTVGEKYPRQFKLGLGQKPAHEPGYYTLGHGSYRADRFGNLEIDSYNIELVDCSESQLKSIKAAA
jgi:hypothetical protein